LAAGLGLRNYDKFSMKRGCTTAEFGSGRQCATDWFGPIFRAEAAVGIRVTVC
jgi:hypothetical protein